MEKARTWVVLGAIVLTVGIIQAWWFSPSAPRPQSSETKSTSSKLVSDVPLDSFPHSNMTLADWRSTPQERRNVIAAEWVLAFMGERVARRMMTDDLGDFALGTLVCITKLSEDNEVNAADKAVRAVGPCINYLADNWVHIKSKLNEKD